MFLLTLMVHEHQVNMSPLRDMPCLAAGCVIRDAAFGDETQNPPTGKFICLYKKFFFK
jgi:hypothetical protein